LGVAAVRLILVCLTPWLAANGCGSASLVAVDGGLGDGGGDHSDGPDTFVPAPYSLAGCFLTTADVQTILPTSGVGQRLDPLTPLPGHWYWSTGCRWSDSANGAYVVLSVEGALTLEGNAVLDSSLGLGADGGASVMAVDGVGEKAVYVNDAGRSQTLSARFGSFLASIAAYSITPDVPEVSLVPLMVKEIDGIERARDL